MSVDRSPGQVAYDGYRMSTGNRSLISGDPLPQWPDLTREIRQAWEDAATCVMIAYGTGRGR